jgi:hypothetical protein
MYSTLALTRGLARISQDGSLWWIWRQDRRRKELVNSRVVKGADGDLLAKCRSYNLSHIDSCKDGRLFG